jgi:L-fucose isomerase-like protein
MVRSITDIRSRYDSISDKQVAAVWKERQERYLIKSVRSRELEQAIRVYLAIKRVLQEEKAAAFGVNCFGDLIIKGGRDVPCLAQLMLREDGYVTACDGDFAAMMSMMLITHMLDKPCMMSNMYPVSYIGALKDHFGDPLAPDESVYPRDRWPNLARLAHCGFVGIVSPEMTPQNKATLTDWGGTYEIKRDGSGCGVDSDMIANEPVTVVELCFDAHTLLLAQAQICETTRHESMPHCESSVLMEFRDLPDFVRNISREHTAIVYGDHIQELEVLGNVLGLNVKIF